MKFFLSGNDQFDLDTFKTTGYVLLKPYLDLEQTTEAPTAQAEIEAIGEEELPLEMTPPPAEDPQVYDPWRQNQAKEEGGNVDTDVDDYDDADDGEEEEEDEDEDYDINDSPTNEEATSDQKAERSMTSILGHSSQLPTRQGASLMRQTGSCGTWSGISTTSSLSWRRTMGWLASSMCCPASALSTRTTSTCTRCVPTPHARSAAKTAALKPV